MAASQGRCGADDEVAEIQEAEVGAGRRHGLPGREPETAFVRLEALDEVEHLACEPGSGGRTRKPSPVATAPS